MLEIIIGILLLLSYVGLVVYAAKGGNLMIGFFVMAVVWVVLGMLGGAVTMTDADGNAVAMTWKKMLDTVFEGGPESWGVTAVIVIFGSWFGRVLVETNIASTIIRKTVELGGDKPLVTTVLLCIVVSLIFTSTFGAGAVVAIGVIVLPILMALGVPKSLAVSSYLMSVGAGMYVNMVLFKQMQQIFDGFQYDGSYLKFGFTAMAVQVIVVIVMVGVRLKGKKKTHAWAAATDGSSQAHAPGLALITPLIPVVMAVVFKWEPIPSFIVAILFALLVCGKFKSYTEASKIISKTFHDGVVDVAGLLGFLLILPMFNKVSGLNSVYFEKLLGGIFPNSALLLTVVFCILAPLGLFRGPLTVFGAGSATLGILNSVGAFSAQLLFPFMYIPTITMNISCCPTQSWNLWALNYSKVSVKDFLKSGVFWGWGICIINTIVAYIMYK